MQRERERNVRDSSYHDADGLMSFPNLSTLVAGNYADATCSSSYYRDAVRQHPPARPPTKSVRRRVPEFIEISPGSGSRAVGGPVS